MNSGGMLPAFIGVVASMSGILLPSTTFTFLASGWLHQYRHLLVVRAFKQGLAPIVIALLLSTGWIMASSVQSEHVWLHWLVTGISAIVVWKTRLPILWLLAAGAALGWFGFI